MIHLVLRDRHKSQAVNLGAFGTCDEMEEEDRLGALRARGLTWGGTKNAGRLCSYQLPPIQLIQAGARTGCQDNCRRYSPATCRSCMAAAHRKLVLLVHL